MRKWTRFLSTSSATIPGSCTGTEHHVDLFGPLDVEVWAELEAEEVHFNASAHDSVRHLKVDYPRDAALAPHAKRRFAPSATRYPPPATATRHPPPRHPPPPRPQAPALAALKARVMRVSVLDTLSNMDLRVTDLSCLALLAIVMIVLSPLCIRRHEERRRRWTNSASK